MRSSWNADRADFLITSGVWNMTSIQELFITGSVVFKYYSGEEPEFIEGDVFRIIVPLNEDYSYDNVKNGDKKTAIKNGDKKISKKTIQNYKKILEFKEEGKEDSEKNQIEIKKMILTDIQKQILDILSENN